MFKTVTKCLEGANKAIEIIGNICIWGMFAIVLVNTILRVAVGYSFPWAEEISKLLMVWMALLVSAIALYENRHVALTFLFEKLSPKHQVVALLIFHVLTLAFCVILTISGTYYVMDNLTSILPASGLARYWLYLPLPIGGGLMGVYSIYLIWQRALQIKGAEPYYAEAGEEEIK